MAPLLLNIISSDKTNWSMADYYISNGFVVAIKVVSFAENI